MFSQLHMHYLGNSYHSNVCIDTVVCICMHVHTDVYMCKCVFKRHEIHLLSATEKALSVDCSKDSDCVSCVCLMISCKQTGGSQR